MAVDLTAVWMATLRRKPDALAVVDRVAGNTWTRSQIEEAASSWLIGAAGSHQLKRKRVLFSEKNGPGWISKFLGLLKAGAVPIPVDGGETSERLCETAQAVGASSICRDGVLHLVDSGRAVRARDVCLIKLTSGSTGTPNALTFSHAHMIADGRQVCSTMGIRPGDLNLGVIPFGHSYGLGNLVMPLLIQGTAIVIGSGPLPRQIADDSIRAKPTVFPAVPALLRLLVESDATREDLASLRLVISAGSPLAVEVAQAFRRKFGHVVRGFYGSSETGGICFDRIGRATLEGRSVGRPLDGVDLRFRKGGRFEVRSAAVMGRGRFSPKDRGELNESGELVLLGRVGRLAKIAGRRLDLGEVEALLRRLQRVSEAFVTVHPRREDSLVAVVASDRRVMDLRREMSGIAASWKIPERIIVLNEFPLTSRGKADTRKLRDIIDRGCRDRNQS